MGRKMMMMMILEAGQKGKESGVHERINRLLRIGKRQKQT